MHRIHSTIVISQQLQQLEKVRILLKISGYRRYNKSVMIIHFEIVNFIKMKLEKNYEYHLFVVYLAAYFTKLTELIILSSNFFTQI